MIQFRIHSKILFVDQKFVVKEQTEIAANKSVVRVTELCKPNQAKRKLSSEMDSAFR